VISVESFTWGHELVKLFIHELYSLIILLCLILQNCRSYRDIPVSEQGRNRALGVHGQFQRDTHNNGLTPASRQVNLSDEGNHELSHDEFPVLGCKKSVSSDSHQSLLSQWGCLLANGFPRPSNKLESGSLSPQPLASAVQSLNSLPGNNRER